MRATGNLTGKGQSACAQSLMQGRWVLSVMENRPPSRRTTPQSGIALAATVRRWAGETEAAPHDRPRERAEYVRAWSTCRDGREHVIERRTQPMRRGSGKCCVAAEYCTAQHISPSESSHSPFSRKFRRGLPTSVCEWTPTHFRGPTSTRHLL